MSLAMEEKILNIENNVIDIKEVKFPRVLCCYAELCLCFGVPEMKSRKHCSPKPLVLIITC